MVSVLVTGSNAGLGYATIRHLAKESINILFLCSRDAQAGFKALASITAEFKSAQVHLVQLDVTSDESIETAKLQVHAQLGDKGLDCLVNNAGVQHVEGTMHERFSKIMEVNVTGAALVLEAFLPLLKKSSHPRVVNVSSTFGSCAAGASPRACTPYAFSKAALNNITAQYAKREPAVRFTALCPGLVNTKLSRWAEDGMTPEEGSRIMVKTVLEETGESGIFFDRNGPLPW